MIESMVNDYSWHQVILASPERERVSRIEIVDSTEGRKTIRQDTVPSASPVCRYQTMHTLAIRLY